VQVVLVATGLEAKWLCHTQYSTKVRPKVWCVTLTLKQEKWGSELLKPPKFQKSLESSEMSGLCLRGIYESVMKIIRGENYNQSLSYRNNFYSGYVYVCYLVCHLILPLHRELETMI
jgi:hypothetical protein